jgi:hypothetical protein
MPGMRVDKPSISMLGAGAPLEKAIVAFEAGFGGIFSLYVATSEAQPNTLWSTPQLLPLPREMVNSTLANPIVHFAGPQLAYLAYLEFRSDRGFRTTYNARVVRLTRQPPAGFHPWVPDVIFRANDVLIDLQEPGALGRNWRDDIPMSFAVGNASTTPGSPLNHLHIAFRAGTSPTSRIVGADCVDGPAGSGFACGVDDSGAPNIAWRAMPTPNIAPGFAGDQIQPGIVANPENDMVALTWYQQASKGDQIYRAGRVSLDGGGVWGTSRDIAGATANSWEPCPSADFNGGPAFTSYLYYGDYAGSVILPFPFGGLVDPNNPTHVLRSQAIVSGYSSSQYGCIDDGLVTFDQHVEVVVW